MRTFVQTVTTITTLSDESLENLKSYFEEYLKNDFDCFEELLSCELDENEFSNEHDVKFLISDRIEILTNEETKV